MHNYHSKLKTRSQELRKNMTKEENKLWYDFLRKLPVNFHRQKMIGNYILDFYCAAHKLAIEVDGAQHYESDAINYDLKRDEYLSSIGVSVIRYSNNDINTNFDGVCSDIMRRLKLL